VTVPRLYVPKLDPSAGRVELPEGEAHHATRVLRLQPGDDVRVFDGRGREWTGRLLPAPRRAAVEIEILAESQVVPEPAVRVIFGAGILKGDHMDDLVRDATMMGAVEIAPLTADHVVKKRNVRISDAASKRWMRVAIASAKQCGRAVVPTIRPHAPLSALLVNQSSAVCLMFVEPGRGLTSTNVVDLPDEKPQSALVLVGPEGGWSSGEIELARKAGVRFVDLGPRTLRADAMATAALSALWARWGQVSAID
jgi:16S rRNA (uracil1498-N3)-methyltransferase